MKTKEERKRILPYHLRVAVVRMYEKGADYDDVTKRLSSYAPKDVTPGRWLGSIRALKAIHTMGRNIVPADREDWEWGSKRRGFGVKPLDFAQTNGRRPIG